MWLGLLYIPAPRDGNTVVLCAWERGRDRPLTFAGPLDATPQMARLFREARRASVIEAPRCDACGAALEVPPL